jgi:hypothetical protein
MRNVVIRLMLICFVLSLSLSSCSNIKVLASWKAEDASNFKDNKILVIARTDNNQARIAFENEIVEAMKNKGMSATPSFSVLPNNVKIGSEPSDELKLAFKDFLETEGYNGIVLTVVKDMEETTKTYSDGGYFAGATVPFYSNYYYNFYSYYYHPMAYSSFGTYVETTSTTVSYKTFVLETVAYDLTNTNDKNIVAVVTSKIEDPVDMTRNAQLYTKKIVEALK